jgi:hypothetical protein
MEIISAQLVTIQLPLAAFGRFSILQISTSSTVANLLA